MCLSQFVKLSREFCVSVPAAQPTELRVWQYNATALLVEWDTVANTVEQMKGQLTGYRINYWEECCQTEQMALFLQVLGQVDHGIIVGLYPDTQYQVNVQVGGRQYMYCIVCTRR